MSSTLRLSYHYALYPILSIVFWETFACASSTPVDNFTNSDTRTTILSNPDTSTSKKIFVHQFQLIGNTVFTTKVLKALIHDYENREITPEELQTIKNKLTQYYLDHGYRNARTLIPDQTIHNGIITLEIVERDLLVKEVKGSRHLRDYAITRQMQFPRLWCEPITYRLRPTFRGDEELQQVYEEETRPYLFNFNFNNHRSPIYGAYRGELSFVDYNLLGMNDVVNLCYGRTEGIEDYSVDYNIPLFSRNTTLATSFADSESTVVTEPFKQLDIMYKHKYMSLSLRHLFYKTDNQSLILFSNLQKLESRSYLLGGPYPFSSGTIPDGESVTTSFNVGNKWLYVNPQRFIQTSFALNFGLDTLDSTINEDGSPDSKFFIVSGALRWTEYLHALDSHLSFYTSIYYANEALLPNEKSTLGGHDKVRGYRENLLARDRTVLASLEWWLPMTHWRLPTLSKVPEDGMVYLIPFFDYGWGQNAGTETLQPNHLSSIGLGLRWLPSETIHADLFWGKALRNVEAVEDDDLQDEGIHFELTCQFP